MPTFDYSVFRHLAQGVATGVLTTLASFCKWVATLVIGIDAERQAVLESAETPEPFLRASA